MRTHTEFWFPKLRLGAIFQDWSWRSWCESGGMGFISVESQRQTGKWKIIPIERLIIIIIIILFSFQDVCSARPFHRDMNGSNELSHILFQVPFLPLHEPHPRPPSSSFRQGIPNRLCAGIPPAIKELTCRKSCTVPLPREIQLRVGFCPTSHRCSCIDIDRLTRLPCNFLPRMKRSNLPWKILAFIDSWGAFIVSFFCNIWRIGEKAKLKNIEKS